MQLEDQNCYKSLRIPNMCRSGLSVGRQNTMGIIMARKTQGRSSSTAMKPRRLRSTNVKRSAPRREYIRMAPWSRGLSTNSVSFPITSQSYYRRKQWIKEGKYRSIRVFLVGDSEASVWKRCREGETVRKRGGVSCISICQLVSFLQDLCHILCLVDPFSLKLTSLFFQLQIIL